MRRKDREVKDFDEIIKIIDGCYRKSKSIVRWGRCLNGQSLDNKKAESKQIQPFCVLRSHSFHYIMGVSKI